MPTSELPTSFPAQAGASTTMPVCIRSASSGFTPLEVEQICRILVRIAIRMEETTHETLREKTPTAGNSVQSLGNPNHTRGRKGRYIRQTVYYQSGEKQHHLNGNAN